MTMPLKSNRSPPPRSVDGTSALPAEPYADLRVVTPGSGERPSKVAIGSRRNFVDVVTKVRNTISSRW
jgi:hypothetical protein